ncbi:hypothetical protein BJ969_003694 [Saccharopolyspora gloriosae]|uniref:Uncharacterized protein n=1 Tax=Saccharopolyspora gloriosae TaxID=455344 RepID=A0A840NE27_9PSEU|nr:hypothetical protein [Saccharopolyspora gloriosae]MBB5070606.1 hypothetical protein [Saccharopolyspora gloriosae]
MFRLQGQRLVRVESAASTVVSSALVPFSAGPGRRPGENVVELTAGT